MLREIVIEKINKHGAIPFDEFMQMVLYFPELGYYTKPNIRIGKEGDFFTAPHLGSVFGFLLSKQIEIFYRELLSPQNFVITEIGPGMGYLATDLLEEINFPVRYNLVEINPTLQKLQMQRLKHFNCFWYNSFEELESFQGVVIFNEVLDALPVRLFEIHELGQVMEVYVDVQNDELIEILLPSRVDTLDYIKEFAPWVLEIKKYRSEVNLLMRSLIELLSRKIKTGYVLIFDYGYTSQEYYHPSRNRGTLLCYHKHTINDNPYINIGEQDITAHVNFTAVEKWAEEAGFKVEGFFSQSKFFTSLCDEEVLKKIYQKNLIQHFKRLVLPQGMGQSHRVMVLSMT